MLFEMLVRGCPCSIRGSILKTGRNTGGSKTGPLIINDFRPKPGRGRPVLITEIRLGQQDRILNLLKAI